MSDYPPKTWALVWLIFYISPRYVWLGGTNTYNNQMLFLNMKLFLEIKRGFSQYTVNAPFGVKAQIYFISILDLTFFIVTVANHCLNFIHVCVQESSSY